jgi:hypothetical protein
MQNNSLWKLLEIQPNVTRRHGILRRHASVVRRRFPKLIKVSSVKFRWTDDGAEADIDNI